MNNLYPKQGGMGKNEPLYTLTNSKLSGNRANSDLRGVRPMMNGQLDPGKGFGISNSGITAP